MSWNLRKVTGEAAFLEGPRATSSGDGGMENLRPSERALLPASGERGGRMWARQEEMDFRRGREGEHAPCLF